MGPLFWKFFGFCLLAQMIMILGLTAAISWRNQNRDAEWAQYAAEGPPQPPVDSAAANPRLNGWARHGRPPMERDHPLPFEPVIGGLIASLIFAAFLARYVAKPIRSLRSAFAAAARGNLDVRLTEEMGRRHDELADLGRDFDRTSIQLKALMDSQRRLLHDVSHELRSPLARLQAAAGLARQQPEKLEMWIERIESELVRMDKLVDELLTLSRVEVGVMGGDSAEVSIGDLVEEVVADSRFESGADGRKVIFEVDTAGLRGAAATGRPELLHRALENVIRNAARHTPEGGRVAIVGRVEHGEKLLRLAVMDEGPGVSDSELASIFQPFFRGANAKKTNGHGLGLAIARSVIEAHGGSIRASNRNGRGLCIEIDLPIVPVH
jgi:two-component system OmpR family sensor kinase